MAQSTIEVPWDIGFPETCASCTAPATKTIRVQTAKPSSQMWYFMFGLLGALAAGRAQAIRFEIPYCENCHRQDRLLRIGIWVSVLLSLALLCGSIMLLSLEQEVATIFGAIGGIIGGMIMIIIPITLAIIRSARLAVKIKAIKEQTESVRLAFRNPTYYEQFWQLNLDRIISFSLDHDKTPPMPPDYVIAFIGRSIDEQNPRSPSSLKGYFQRGQIYLQTNAPGRALADLDRVMEVTGFENRYFLEAQFFRGQAHMQLGNSTQAQTDLENYVKASSNRSRVKQAKRWIKQLKRG